ncbi:hypothetical protein CEXT_799831 [Caerostris extrusa]|uniref:Uncharacterized protein n=1 Tax=Caerostris extrusa TaxID=172846 RepID=A0AAV4U018_CAEEX|nr:hypothetical protein CEXT_799831 [Caerostris extrusa]
MTTISASIVHAMAGRGRDLSGSFKCPHKNEYKGIKSGVLELGEHRQKNIPAMAHPIPSWLQNFPPRHKKLFFLNPIDVFLSQYLQNFWGRPPPPPTPLRRDEEAVFTFSMPLKGFRFLTSWVKNASS